MRRNGEDDVYAGKYWGKSAAGILIGANETGNILLLYRSPDVFDPNMWGIPGGKVDRGGNPRGTAAREVREECGPISGLSASMEPVHVYEAPDGSGFRFFTFLGAVEQEFEPDLNWENTDYVWVAPQTAAKGRVQGRPVHPNVVTVIKLVLSR
jgi:8-oxo-dGTP pyrophosphatase MutT (NUDIX family)